MNVFAKLFNTDIGQILVKADTNDDCNPEARLYFSSKGFGVCSIAFTFEDNEDGWDKQEAEFNEMDEVKAFNLVKNIINQIPSELQS